MNGEVPDDSNGANSGAAPEQVAVVENALQEPGESDHAKVRRRLTGQFEAWLDRMLADEPAPQGLPAEIVESVLSAPAPGDEAADLYTLFAALTTLSGEIRLQGRAFKQVAETVAPLGEMGSRLEALSDAQRETTEQLAQLEESLTEEEEEVEEVIPGPPAKDVLAALFDLYDRLDRGKKTLEVSMRDRAAPSWLARLVARGSLKKMAAATESLRESYRLTLARLEAALNEWGIERIGAPGRPFDPRRMTAIEMEQTDAHPDGTVVEVYRSGYVVHDQVLATAQVKVARMPM